MIVKVDKSFVKDIGRLNDHLIRRRIADCIDQLRNSDSLSQIKSIRKIAGETSYYRIRMGDFRLGIKVSGNLVLFIRVLHRKEIYRYFP